MAEPRERAERGGYASSDRTAAELPPPPASMMALRTCAFTRAQLIEALTHLEARIPVSGPVAGLINAESMADSIIGALEYGKKRSDEGSE